MQTSRLKIVGIGDSTTAGTPGFLSPLEAPPYGRGNPESQYAFWMMKRRPEWTVLNRGINGQRSEEILARFQRDVAKESPDYAIILAGVNDIYEGYPRQTVERDLIVMYRQALAARIVPVAATVLPYNTASDETKASIRQLNKWIQATANDLGVPFCDTFRAVADSKESFRLRSSPDGLHPDVEGYRRMGEALAEAVEGHLRRVKALKPRQRG